MAGQWFESDQSGAYDPANPHRGRLPAGTRVGAYTIVRPLGAGAMGAVYQAVDDGESEVALKIIHPDFDADPTARQLMAQEVAALQRLRHPNVAKVLDAELDGSEAFVVTELIPGKPLDKEIADGGPLDAVDLYELALQLSQALLALEAAGVVHRDIKPSNIIVGENGPVLIDFGIAREVEAPRQSTRIVNPVRANVEEEARLGDARRLSPSKPEEIPSAMPVSIGRDGVVVASKTVSNQYRSDHVQYASLVSTGSTAEAGGALSQREPGTRLMGTPGYLAPELLGGAPPSANTDWWSWAAVLAFAGTGRPPFGYGAPDDVFNRELHGRVDLVGLPPRTAAALLGALSVEPHARTAPEEVILALRRDAATASTGAPAPAPMAPVNAEPTAMLSGAPTAEMFPVPAATRIYGDGSLPGGLMPDVEATGFIDYHATQVVQPQPPMIPPVVAAHSVVEPAQRRCLAPLKQASISPVSQVELADSHFNRLSKPPQVAPSGYQEYHRPKLRKRRGVIAVLALPFIAAAGHAPILAFTVFAVAVLVMRVIGTIANDLQIRRELAGQTRNSDVAVVAVRSPLTVVRALIGALPQLLVGAATGLMTMALGWWLFGSRGPVPLAAEWVHPVVLAFAMACALLVTWFGTHSALTRYGARHVINVVGPGSVGNIIAVVAFLIAAFLALTLFLEPVGVINWWPGVAPPSL